MESILAIVTLFIVRLVIPISVILTAGSLLTRRQGLRV